MLTPKKRSKKSLITIKVIDHYIYLYFSGILLILSGGYQYQPPEISSAPANLRDLRPCSEAINSILGLTDRHLVLDSVD